MLAALREPAVGAIAMAVVLGFLTLGVDSRRLAVGGAAAAFGLLSAAGQGIGILLAGLAVSPVSLIVLLEIQGLLCLVAAVLGRVLPRPDHEVRVDSRADG